MADFSAYAVTGTDNPAKQISVEEWNGLLGDLETATSVSVTPQQFGAIGDGVTDDGAAFVAAIAYLKTIAANDDGTYKGSVPLLIPPGEYYLGTTTLDITHQLLIEGQGGTANAAKSVILRWAANTTGIRIQYYNTSGAGDVGAAHYSGASAHIKGLQLEGGYTNFASEGEYHGIHAKAAVVVEDCFVHSFQGDGFYANASAGAGAPTEGNANVLNVRRLRVDNCRNGIFLDGADTNSGYFEGCNFNQCRQWAVWDSSFLGNTYISCHAAGCGQSASGMTPTMVSHGGNRYYPRWNQVANAQANAPSGTTADTAYWYYYAAGGVDAARSIPAWSNGMALRAGGAYLSDGANAATVFVGCYSEQDQSGSQIVGPAMVFGGLHGAGVRGDGTYFRSAGGTGVVDALQINTGFELYAISSVRARVNFYGAALQNGNITSNDGSRALVLEGVDYISINAAAAFIGNFQASGFDLASGKALSVNGQQVVSARGAAVADATDAATAITQLNALLARCRAHGLIAT